MDDTNNQVEGKKNSTASLKKRKAKRVAISQRIRFKVIEDFLSSCGANEAEAIRVIIKYTNGSQTASLSASDKSIINCYLNTEYAHYASCATTDDIREHRLKRAKKIRVTIKQFFDIEKYEKAVDVLYEVALNTVLITEFAKERQNSNSVGENTSSTS